ncbi:hypothetical protein FKW77_001078 [Venturia effusa]|uniref:BHLH domain-containing protein n=1 Tax=Venturia effusa TaxID=50376 RepID=A0A517L4W4_9PEZI|nr:hypothetical protein FKW77_001078 [Venturia effusa]
MENFMDPRHDSAQDYQPTSTPLSTSHTSTISALSGEPVTPLDHHSLGQTQPSFSSQLDFSPSSDSHSKSEYKGLEDDYFLDELVQREPLSSMRESHGVQNGFDLSSVYGNQFQRHQPPFSRDWSNSTVSTTSTPIETLHGYTSRKSSAQANRNPSFNSSSTPASQFDRFLALTPLTTPGEIGSYQASGQDFPFYPDLINPQAMSSTQSPLDSFSDDPQWDDNRSTGLYEDTTPAQNFTDTSTKRTRAEGRSDAISACWTSPLCPNHTDPRDGTPPNPATCGGGCAPFLFGEEPLPDSVNDASLDLPVMGVDQVTMASRPRSPQQQGQQQRRQSQSQSHQQAQPSNKAKVQRAPKRSDPDTKHEEQGRSLSKPANSNLKQSPSPEANIGESVESTKKASRQPHNKVEQKYRDSINNQMEALRKVVPSLSESARACIDDADIEDLPVPNKPSKAVILASATAFIKAQSKEKRQLEIENAALRQRMQALQAMLTSKCDDCSLMQRAIDKDESAMDESSVRAGEPPASEEPDASGERSAGKSRFANMCDYFFKNKTGADTADTDAQSLDNAQKRRGRYTRPEPDLELNYPLVDIKELDQSTVEIYNARVREMSKRLSGPLRAAGRVETGTFTRDLAEEIIGTDLCMRRHVDEIHHELVAEIRQILIEEPEGAQEGQWGLLERRPSLISQRIDEDEEEFIPAYAPGEKRRGKQRVP